MSHEIRVAEAETVALVEGNMSVPAKRGAAALPGFRTPITLERTALGRRGADDNDARA